MPRGKHRFGLVGGMVMVLALTSCATPAPTVHTSAPVPVATPTPAFTSDADALAAAVAFYKRYLVASNAALQKPGSPNQLAHYLGAAELAGEMKVVDELNKSRVHLDGTIKFRKASLQRVAPRRSQISIYVCIDLTHAIVRSDNGTDVTPANRSNLQTLLVALTGLPKEPSIQSSSKWSGSSAC